MFSFSSMSYWWNNGEKKDEEKKEEEKEEEQQQLPRPLLRDFVYEIGTCRKVFQSIAHGVPLFSLSRIFLNPALS